MVTGVRKFPSDTPADLNRTSSHSRTEKKQRACASQQAKAFARFAPRWSSAPELRSCLMVSASLRVVSGGHNCCGAATHGAKISLDGMSVGWVIGQLPVRLWRAAPLGDGRSELVAREDSLADALKARTGEPDSGDGRLALRRRL